MIVPADRLLVWTGVVGFAVAIAAAAAPALTWPALAVVAVFGLVAATDAMISSRRLRGVRVTSPAVIRLAKGQESHVDFDIDGAAHLSVLTLGFTFPTEYVAAPETAGFSVKNAERQQVAWPCTGIKRGAGNIDSVHLQTPSRMRLWQCRTQAGFKAEIRVYPNLAPERKRLAGLFLNRNAPGLHTKRLIGKGRELEKLREYMPGDLYEDVCWKATARRGKPVTKVYQVERTQEVYVLLDCSRLSARAANNENTPKHRKINGEQLDVSPVTHLERYITSALALGLVAERQGDFFGVLAFDNQVRSFVRARNGKQHYAACRDALFAIEPRRINPDFTNLFSFIRMRMRRRALLIILTDLDDPLLASQFVQNLNVITNHHLVLVNALKQPQVAPLFASPNSSSADDVYERLAGHAQWRALRELQQVLARRGVNLNIVENEALTTQIVDQYLAVKQRQLL